MTIKDPSNIVTAFFERAKRGGNRACARFKKGGEWSEFTWTGLERAVIGVASELVRLGIAPGERVAICSRTSIEWTISDLAIMSVGAISVPIYSSLTSESFAKIVADSSPRLIFAEDLKLAKRFEEGGVRGIPIIHFRDSGDESGFWHLTRTFKPSMQTKIAALAEKIDPSDIATIVYTSGTTGEQKGVMLSHSNLISEVKGVCEVFRFTSDEVGLACLPQAHVLGRLMQFYCLVQGTKIAYAEGIDKLGENYLELKPHFLCGVPRMLEKIYELVNVRVQSSSKIMQCIFNWSLNVGLMRSMLLEKGLKRKFSFSLKYAIAEALVFRKIRKSLGGRLYCFICGGAPLNENVAKFFHAAGILVLEGYGLTETFAAATVNSFEDYRFGTVGKPINGLKIKISDEGEILFQGPTVFRGYWKMPIETKAAFDEHGYFRTGDLGEFTRDGFIRITGRKKEIIVTAGGKNVAPQMIESLISLSPYINHVMVHGDGRKYLTALVTVNEVAAMKYLEKFGLKNPSGEPLSRHPAIRELIAKHIEDQNKKLASFETVKKFAVLDRDFSIETGELTPTLKIRREFTNKKYSEILDELYR